jgi:sulfur carrier protein
MRSVFVGWQLRNERGGEQMTLTVNGETEEWPDRISLAKLIAARMRSDQGVAAAVDGAVAPRSTWADLVLHDGQAVELLTAVQGG